MCMLDASKAFDRVNLLTLFKTLYSRGMCPIYLKLLMFVSDASGDHMMEAPNDTAYKRWSCHSGLKLCVEPPRPQQWGPDLPFWACGPAGWLALLLTKAGDVENNPGPTTLNKKVGGIV